MEYKCIGKPFQRGWAKPMGEFAEEKREESKEGCTFGDLRCKEVIDQKECVRLGYICDLELNLADGRIKAIILPGDGRFFGLFGRGDDIIIPWVKIKKIGEDIILVDCEKHPPHKKRGGRFWF